MVGGLCGGRCYVRNDLSVPADARNVDSPGRSAARTIRNPVRPPVDSVRCGFHGDRSATGRTRRSSGVGRFNSIHRRRPRITPSRFVFIFVCQPSGAMRDGGFRNSRHDLHVGSGRLVWRLADPNAVRAMVAAAAAQLRSISSTDNPNTPSEGYYALVRRILSSGAEDTILWRRGYYPLAPRILSSGAVGTTHPSKRQFSAISGGSRPPYNRHRRNTRNQRHNRRNSCFNPFDKNRFGSFKAVRRRRR